MTFYIAVVKRRVVYMVGSISFVKSEQYEHFTLRWKGHWYCLAATVHEAIKKEFFYNKA